MGNVPEEPITKGDMEEMLARFATQLREDIDGVEARLRATAKRDIEDVETRIQQQIATLGKTQVEAAAKHDTAITGLVSKLDSFDNRVETIAMRQGAMESGLANAGAGRAQRAAGRTQYDDPYSFGKSVFGISRVTR